MIRSFESHNVSCYYLPDPVGLSPASGPDSGRRLRRLRGFFDSGAAGSFTLAPIAMIFFPRQAQERGKIQVDDAGRLQRQKGKR